MLRAQAALPLLHGSTVTLSPSFARFSDAARGPLQPGKYGLVVGVELNRAKVGAQQLRMAMQHVHRSSAHDKKLCARPVHSSRAPRDTGARSSTAQTNITTVQSVCRCVTDQLAALRRSNVPGIHQCCSV